MTDKPSDFIAVIDDVLHPDLCKDIITTFEKSPHQEPGRTGGGVDTDRKLSTDIPFSEKPEFKDQFQQVMQKTSEQLVKYIEQHYFALIGPIGLTVRDPKTGQPVKLTQDNFEEAGKQHLPGLVNHLFRIGLVNAQRYTAGEGGYPHWHSEVFPQLQHNEALHRILLFMFYLNDVDEGGETDFYYQDRSVKPKTGRMVIAPAYFTHTHRGNMPKSNDKYILTSWLLFNRAEKIYTPAR